VPPSPRAVAARLHITKSAVSTSAPAWDSTPNNRRWHARMCASADLTRTRVRESAPSCGQVWSRAAASPSNPRHRASIRPPGVPSRRSPSPSARSRRLPAPPSHRRDRPANRRDDRSSNRRKGRSGRTRRPSPLAAHCATAPAYDRLAPFSRMPATGAGVLTTRTPKCGYDV
jgi:hypothetical protein